MTTNDQSLEAEGAKHASGRKSLSKSPSLQLLRRLHQPIVGLNDVSISSDDGDWDSDPTVVHRRSVASSCRTSRCSSVMSTALDWEEVQNELSAIVAEADAISDAEDEMNDRQNRLVPGRSRSPLKRQQPSPSEAKKLDEAAGGQSLDEQPEATACYFDRHRGAWVKKNDPTARSALANRIFVRNFSKSTSEQELRDYFETMASVFSIRLIKKNKSRSSPRRALIQFVSDYGVLKVLTDLFSAPLVLNGRKLVIEIAKPYKQSINLNQLPVEVLCHIFEYLGLERRIQNECVCQLWYTVSTDGNCSVTPDEIRNLFVKFKVGDRELNSILNRCGRCLVNLNLSQEIFGNFSYRAASAVAKHCPALRELDLSHVPLTNYSLRVLAQSCSKLKSVTFEQGDFSDQGLWWIVKLCQNLESLSLSSCSHAIGSCFHEFNKGLKCLKLMNSNLKPRAIFGLLHCDAIEELNLDDSIIIDQDDSLFGFFEQFSSSLKKFSFCAMDPTPVYDSLLSSYLPNLEELNLSDSSQVNDELITHIGLNCFKLRKLDISETEVTETGLSQLSSSCLSDLNISNLQLVTNESIEWLALHGTFVRLNLSGMELITDHAIFVLANHCMKLAYLDISNCPKITDAIVESFLETFAVGSRETHLEVFAKGTLITKFIKLTTFQVNNFVGLCE